MIQISPNTKDLIITLSNLYFYNCISAIKTQSVQELYLSNFTVTNSNSSSYAALQFSSNGNSVLSIVNGNFTSNRCNCIKLDSTSNQPSLDFLLESVGFYYNNGDDSLLIFDSSLIVSNTSKIKNCEFYRNTAPSVEVSSSQGILNVSSTNFAYGTYNIANWAVYGSTQIIFYKCVIEYNTAESWISIVSSSNDTYAETISCTIRNNVGSVIKLSDSVYQDQYSTFYNNSAEYGAVLYSTDSSTTSFTGSLLYKNSASTNGVIYLLVGSTLTIQNSNFSYNSASSKGAGIFCDQNSTFSIYSSWFAYNSAYQGSSIYTQHSNNVYIYSSSFVSNSALASGCIFILESGITINNCTFKNNTGTDSPAIRVLYDSTLTIANSSFMTHSGQGANIDLGYSVG